MDTHARYMFDAVFASTARGQAAEADIPRHTDQTLEATRDGAYQQGLADGRAQSNSEASSHLDQLVTRLIELAQTANENWGRTREECLEQATRLALVAARTLVPTLISREPEGELMELFGECMAQLEGAPQLVIHVPEKSAGELKARLETAAANLNAGNDIRVLADQSMAEGDCRIAWATGEVSRSMRDLEEEINSIIERRYPSGSKNTETRLAPTAEDVVEPQITEIDQSPAHEGNSQ